MKNRTYYFINDIINMMRIRTKVFLFTLLDM